jgi:hypothetical protein
MTATLTARQLEALAMAALHGNPFRRYHGFTGARSNMGGAERRMVDELRNRGLIPRKQGESDLALTLAGVDALLANIDLVQNPPRSEVKQYALNMRPQIEAEEARVRENEEAARAKRKAIAESRIAKRNAAIPAKLVELAREHRIKLDAQPENPPLVGDAATEKALANMVALWNAIVDADAAL